MVTLFLGLAACAQRFSPDAPTGAPAPEASSSGLDTLFAPVVDAGPKRSGSRHALIITQCREGVPECPSTDGGGPEPEASYRVVFGSGNGTIRSRSQAWATLFGELRDRTSLGEHLDAQPRKIRDGRDSDDILPTHEKGRDAFSSAATQIMSVVDAAGEIVIDVLSEWGQTECEVSMGLRAPDGGVGLCLVEGPPRATRPGRAR